MQTLVENDQKPGLGVYMPQYPGFLSRFLNPGYDLNSGCTKNWTIMVTSVQALFDVPCQQ